MSSLKLNNLSKSYGQAEILKKINLDIVEGEFLVLVGPSGCGKSTTLRLIAGLEEASEGEIFIGDEMVNGLDPSKRDIAMVFQNYALYPHMTVFENMAFGLKLRKIANTEIEKRVTEVAEILMLEEYLQRRPKALSGGQRQRVALGRAIVRQPKVFLFDEPLSNLDAKLRGEMRVEIKKLHRLLGTTMVYVTHDQTEAMTMGDRIAVMNDGIIEQLDRPRDLYNHPKNRFVASFIGSPEMNLFMGELKQNQSHWEFISNELTIQIEKTHYQYSKLKEEKVIFGIRPEDIHDSYFAKIKDDKNTINTKVEFIEYLGAEMNVHLTAQSNSFTAKFKRRIDSKMKGYISIIFDVNQGHFFIIENGNIL